MPGFTAWRVFVLRYTTVAELDLGSRVDKSCWLRGSARKLCRGKLNTNDVEVAVLLNLLPDRVLNRRDHDVGQLLVVTVLQRVGPR